MAQADELGEGGGGCGSAGSVLAVGLGKGNGAWADDGLGGEYICAEGRYRKGDGDPGPEKPAGILVGLEFGTVAQSDLPVST